LLPGPDVSLLAGIGLGLILALQLAIYLERKEPAVPAPIVAIPQPLIDALAETVAAKQAHDQAQAALSKAADNLSARRQALETLEDQHLQPGVRSQEPGVRSPTLDPSPLTPDH
jgi:hypothetical protein